MSSHRWGFLPQATANDGEPRKATKLDQVLARMKITLSELGRAGVQLPMRRSLVLCLEGRWRRSEEIALVHSDLDLVNGIASINKARVAGVDRLMTKTDDDRRVRSCPHALFVLKRQLCLRASRSPRQDRPRSCVISGIRRAHPDAAGSASSLAPDTGSR